MITGSKRLFTCLERLLWVFRDHSGFKEVCLSKSPNGFQDWVPMVFLTCFASRDVFDGVQTGLYDEIQGMHKNLKEMSQEMSKRMQGGCKKGRC